MVSSISNSSAVSQYNNSNTSSTNTLTQSQSSSLSAVLSGYDANNLSESDAQSIVSAIKELGIEPGKALGDALNDAGFDPHEIADLAGLGPNKGGSAGGPPPPSDGVQASIDFLEELDIDSESSLEEIIAALEQLKEGTSLADDESVVDFLV